jgi:hypothetical protein
VLASGGYKKFHVRVQGVPVKESHSIQGVPFYSVPFYSGVQGVPFYSVPVNQKKVAGFKTF